MIVVLFGTDEFSIDEEAKRLALEDMPPEMASLNVTRLNSDSTVDSVMAATMTVPFLTPHRVVRVDGLLSFLAKSDKRTPRSRSGQLGRNNVSASALEVLGEFLPTVPDDARLIFTEPTPVDRASRRRSSPTFFRGPFGKALKQHATRKEFTLPQGTMLLRWLEDRARRLGGCFLPAAAELLAQVSDGNIRSLNQEVSKLVTYAGPSRGVSTDDVRLLVYAAGQPDVFAFVDALATGRQSQALAQLSRFSAQGQAPEYLIAMIARQVRLLNQVKSLAQAEIPTSQHPSALGVHPFVARKVNEQARSFDADVLEAMHRAVLNADLSIKTGQSDGVLALELLTVQLVTARLSRGRRARRGQT